jgi:hypothetical protein
MMVLIIPVLGWYLFLSVSPICEIFNLFLAFVLYTLLVPFFLVFIPFARLVPVSRHLSWYKIDAVLISNIVVPGFTTPGIPI